LNRDRSPLFNGQIQGVGPRYCPSIEDKAFRYPDRHSHHIFLEPEGLNSESMYPNGISTSMPEDIQLEFVHSIVGLENAGIIVPGYAVEYEVIQTSGLKQSLESKSIPGLYFAGQVNGTSGYEEAAGQGLVAGFNAALSFLGKEPLLLGRSDSYIGVMIEDLVSNDRDEPYRLFTARAENRLDIREDNAITRMAPYRKMLGLNLPIDQYMARFAKEIKYLEDICDQTPYPNDNLFVGRFGMYGTASSSSVSLSELLKWPTLDPVVLLGKELSRAGVDFDFNVISCVAISKKYEGHIKKSKQQVDRWEKLGKMKINWHEIAESANISFECRLRIKKIKPETFGQLRNMEGIRPATLVVVAGRIY
jgi:tRNA uridine 5-carboxymethylaminomethyl modification enzyme